ncbi:MAG: acyl-CoA dehydrogenase family protein [Hyphomonadaceae bacterium]|nr:acyl-CoA dehydrogenase family protein [Hyphomonadaceae bacterium]
MIVDLLPTEEQTLIGDSVAGLLQKLPVERLRDQANFYGAAEAAMWDGFRAIGLFSLSLPEDAGGAGLGFAEECLCARLLGNALTSPDVLATMLAVRFAFGTGDAKLAAALQSGETRACFASADDVERAQIVDGRQASYALSWRRADASLWRFEPGAVQHCLDETILLRNATPSGKRANAEGFALRARIAVAAYLVGVAEAVRDMAVAYAGAREQFGQPIGAFQAVKHACADMAVRAEAAMAQTWFAALALDHGGGEEDAAAAQVLAIQAALENARANVQVHGGMGFTYECDAHFYLKRAHVFAALNANDAVVRAMLLNR